MDHLDHQDLQEILGQLVLREPLGQLDRRVWQDFQVRSDR